MDYFLSIENTPYHRWQTELLIESFKMQGLQDKLLIAIANNSEQQFGGFTDNLLSHPRKFMHENFGKDKGCKALNKPHAILAAMSNNLLQQPFAILHPDMILCKPVEDPGIYNFVFSVSVNPDRKDRLTPHLKKLLADRAVVEDLPWISADGLLICNHVSVMFFNRVIEYALGKLPNWDDVDKMAWAMAMYELYSLSLFQGKYYECELFHNIEEVPNACVIHYRRGVVPHFSKKQFLFNNTSMLTLGAPDPMNMLLQFDGTTAMQFVNKVVQSYRSNTTKTNVSSEKPVSSDPQQMFMSEDIIEPVMPD
jgi:hypothetical protein